MLSGIKTVVFRQGNDTFKGTQIHKGMFTFPASGGYSSVTSKEVEGWLRSDNTKLVEATSDVTKLLQGVIDA